jgi:hypothetical protein
VKPAKPQHGGGEARLSKSPVFHLQSSFLNNSISVCISAALTQIYQICNACVKKNAILYKNSVKSRSTRNNLSINQPGAKKTAPDWKGGI